MTYETMEVDTTDSDKTHCSKCVFCSTDDYGHLCNIPKISKFLDIVERQIRQDTTPQNKQIHFVNVVLKECKYFHTEDSIKNYLPIIITS